MKKNIVFLVSIFSFLSGCTQTQNVDTRNCEMKLTILYDKYKSHFIFCSYYFNKVQKLSGADTVIKDLLFYHRDSSDMAKIKYQDNTILQNLKRKLCAKNDNLINSITNWCKTSERISSIRNKVDFTLEGYLELLYEFESTKSTLTPYLTTTDKTIYSLSSDEMEIVYFSSITTLSFLGEHEREQFYKKFLTWNFVE